MTERLRKIIRAFKIDEVSAVRKPASEHAKVLIMKSDDTDTPETGDIAVTEIRKILDDGCFDDFEKSDYMGLLDMLAAEIQMDGESIQKAFTRGLETPAGRELFGLMKRAGGSEVRAPKDAVQDTVARRNEPATIELELKAQELARKTGLSYEQAYTRIIDDPAYRRLRDDATGERQLALVRSLSIFDARNLEPAKPFPDYGSPGQRHPAATGRTSGSVASGQCTQGGR
jgi:hypothetical protein